MNEQKLYPLISVYMPTHNREHVIERAINSVIAQDYPNWELIIVDDGGKDSTPKLVQSYIDRHSHIRFIRHEVPKGACAARNTAIRAARGEFVTGLDDDDEFLPQRLRLLYESYSDEYAFVCSAWHVKPRTFRNTLRDWLRYKSGVFTLEQLLSINQVGNQVLVRRDRILAIDGFDEELLAWQDYDMWVRLVQKFGTFMKIKQKTMVINEFEAIGGRISVSPKRRMGIKRFTDKHKVLMSSFQLEKCEKLSAENDC